MARVAGAAATPASGVTSLDVPVPSGTAPFQIAVAYLYAETDDVTITGPAGFTLKAESLANQGASRGRLQVWWKRLTESDSGNYSFSWPTAAYADGYVELFSGRTRTGDPFGSSTNLTQGASSTGVTLAVSVTPLNEGEDLTGAGTNHGSNAGAWTVPTGMTEVLDRSPSVSHLTVAYQENIPAAADTKTFTGTGNTGGSYLRGFLGTLMPDDRAVIVDVGASATGTTGAVAYPWPTNYTVIDGDVAYLAVESQQTAGLTAPSNSGTWTNVANSPRAQGSNVIAVNVWRSILVAGQAAPSVPAASNHQIGRLVVLRNVDTTAPEDFSADSGGTAVTTITATGGTAAGDKRLVLAALTSSADIATVQISAVAAASLTSVQVLGAASTTNGGGGGLTLASGYLATAGSTGSFTAPLASSQSFAAIVLAARPAPDRRPRNTVASNPATPRSHTW